MGSSYRDIDNNYAHVRYADWGMYFVGNPSYVYGDSEYFSFGFAYAPSYGVRPVVSLEANIELEKDSASTETTYNIK